MKKLLIIATLIMVVMMVCSISFAADTSIEGLSSMASSVDSKSLFSGLNTGASIPKDGIIRVQLDGKILDFTDSEGNVVNPQIISDRTMVPMRKIFETFDATVEWDEPTRTVKATTPERVITLTIDNNIATVNELSSNTERKVELDQSPVIVDGRTLVPVRFIAESLGKEVGWDNENRTVIIIDCDKLAELLKEKVPSLQKLFDMKIEEVNSFKSTSALSGRFAFETESESQAITLDGNAKVTVNKAQEMETELKLSIKGEGEELSQQLAQNGYDDINAKVIIKGENLYIGILDGEDYKWTDASQSMSSVSNASIAYNIDKISDYRAVVELLKSTIGELTVNSYAIITSLIDSLGVVLSDDAISLTESNGQKILAMKFDFDKFYNQYLDNEKAFDFVLNVVLVARDQKIQKETIILDGSINDVQGQKVELNFKIESEYSDLNQDFTILAPANV